MISNAVEYADFKWGKHVPIVTGTFNNKEYRVVRAELLRIHSSGLTVSVDNTVYNVPFSVKIVLKQSETKVGTKTLEFYDMGDLLVYTPFSVDLVDLANKFNDQFTQGYYTPTSQIHCPVVYLLMSGRDTIRAIGFLDETVAYSYDRFLSLPSRWGDEEGSAGLEVYVVGSNGTSLNAIIHDLGGEPCQVTIPGYTQAQYDSFAMQFEGLVVVMAFRASLLERGEIVKRVTSTSRPLILD